MKVHSPSSFQNTTRVSQSASVADTAAAQEPKDQVDFSGHRPAHRDVKKLFRGAAGLVGAAGVGAAAYELLTSGSLEGGLAKAGAALAAGAAGVIGVDVASGAIHHWGDNFGLPRPQTLQHTQWHTDPTSTEYCLVGFSNKAMDKMGVWPKWEKIVHNITGKTPVSWQVPAYKQFALGEIDRATLKTELEKAGLPRHEG